MESFTSISKRVHVFSVVIIIIAIAVVIGVIGIAVTAVNNDNVYFAGQLLYIVLSLAAALFVFMVISNLLLIRRINKASEKERVASELNQVFIDSAPYVIALWKKDSVNPVFVNDQAKAFFGIDNTKLITDNLFSISPEYQPCGTPTALKAVEVVFKTYDIGYHRFEWLHHKKDGTLIPSECIFMSFIRNGEEMLVSYTRDLTEIKAAEAAADKARLALEHRERLLSTVNQAAVTLLAIDDESEIEAATIHSMETIGICLEADRICLNRCFKEDSGIRISPVEQWHLDKDDSDISKLTIDHLPAGSYPMLEQLISSEISYNGPISNLPANEQKFFIKSQSQKSIVIIPLMIDGQLWGLINIDFFHEEKILSEKEMDIMHSAGLMFVNVHNRFENKELAITDPLTGVRNRRFFMESSLRELENCISLNEEYSLIITDVDSFKLINDKYGHSVGDEALKIFTARVKHVLKHETMLARYGGEEFVVTLTGVNHEDAIKTAWRINKAIEDSPFRVGDIEIRVTASFGVASISPECNSLPEIIKSADKALYEAKNSGKNTVVGANSVL